MSVLLQLPSLFFFNDTATTEIYTLSLHDALPIWQAPPARRGGNRLRHPDGAVRGRSNRTWSRWAAPDRGASRSEEHTSELQSQSNLVCRLLLEKKKKSDKTLTGIPTSGRSWARSV